MTKLEKYVLFLGGVLAILGLFISSLQYPVVAALLIVSGIVAVSGVLGEKICVCYLLINLLFRIFHKEPPSEQRICKIQRKPPSESIFNNLSE